MRMCAGGWVFICVHMHVKARVCLQVSSSITFLLRCWNMVSNYIWITSLGCATWPLWSPGTLWSFPDATQVLELQTYAITPSFMLGIWICVFMPVRQPLYWLNHLPRSWIAFLSDGHRIKGIRPFLLRNTGVFINDPCSLGSISNGHKTEKHAHLK